MLRIHPNIKKYTLYTTMEPCPMCFGIMAMIGIRNMRYAAKDGFAGVTELNYKSNIQVVT
jgi:tRNA(adenine34) deaminase